MITIRKATEKNICILSQKLLELLEDKNSQLYQENVAKFGIPEEYVKRAFSEKSLLEAVSSRKSTIYLALENGCKILGFAQTIPQTDNATELDRIVVFPDYTRKGIGTLMLTRILKDQERKNAKTVIVNAGKEEEHARRFYEKNGFKPIKETTIDAPWGNKMTLITYQLEPKPT